MPLIVEDGSLVPNADTYVSRDDLIAYGAARGVVIPDTEVADTYLIKGMDYLTLSAYAWKGLPVSDTQSLAWPRKCVYITGSNKVFPSDAIPPQLIKAQCELALAVASGIDLVPNTSLTDGFITRDKVDVIETEYSEAVAMATLGSLPILPGVAALLSGLIDHGGRVRTQRI
jgi:hypothetical protein